ncbi:ribosomal protein S18-alanine N-acetyltransferase [Candidatus Neomarinimicrobiota bacterium]
MNQILDIEDYCYENPWPREAFEEEIENQELGIGVVAEVDGIIVGFFTGLAVAGELQLHNIAVHPDYRGQGIARALMATVDQYGKERNCDRVLLEVRKDNEIANRLYLSLGYEEVGDRKNYYGASTDATLYTKNLRPQ